MINYLKIKFKGTKNNPFAVGTSVKLYHGESIILQELIPSRGFQSSMDYVMTIGLGDVKTLDSLTIFLTLVF